MTAETSHPHAIALPASTTRPSGPDGAALRVRPSLKVLPPALAPESMEQERALVQFGLPYSPNLGDGVISECLRHALATRRPGWRLTALDLAGRTAQQGRPVRWRAAALSALRRLPAPVRARIVRRGLQGTLDRIEPIWRAALEDKDLAIIGGGQIFSDADLNFALKLGRVAGLLKETQVPAAIYAAGLSGRWSRQGHALFSTLTDTRLDFIGLRDTASIQAWRAAFPDHRPVLTPDPALLAASCYAPPSRRFPRRIGLGVTSSAVLSYHANGEGPRGRAFFADLAAELCAEGHDVMLFCNGAVEDQATLYRVAADPRLRALTAQGRLHCAPRPEHPAALAALVAGCSGVVAHRLHACILARAYAIPCIGLGWDSKVEQFFEAQASRHCFVGTAEARPRQVALLLSNALASGISADAHRDSVDSAWAGIDRLLDATA